MTGEGSRKRPIIPELLAPAGSFDALRAAVGAGADAVYLGGRKFGARAYAENFDDNQLVEAFEYAHRADVRVYVTVNTLLSDAELQEAGRFLLFLYEQGADGVLVQDPGLILFARKKIPGLSLHGSTQMTLHNHTGVRWAAEMGLKRVVLARELSISEICLLADRLRGYNIGLEVFIHGAICYSYSGQCLLSSVIGGRSGNRGRCAQPCRKPYMLLHGAVDVYDRIIQPQVLSAPSYCLSTRDLCTYRQLDKLLHLPIDALKIEGRMKSPEYVATVVRVYRSAIDRIVAGTWSPLPEDTEDLLLAFNRGFTGGHLFGEPVMGALRPDSQGLLLGTVAGYDVMLKKMTIQLEGETIPERGDGIQIVMESGEETGLCIHRTPSRTGSSVRIPVPVPVQIDAPVYLTRRASLEQAASKAMKRPFYHLTPATILVSWDKRRAIFQGTIHARERELSFRYESILPWQEARTHPLTPEQIKQQLQKSGGTPFAMSLELQGYPGGMFLPLSALNTLRRDLLSYMESFFLKSHCPTVELVTEARKRIESSHWEVRAPARSEDSVLTVYVCTVQGVEAALMGGADSVCLDANGSELRVAADLCRERGVPLIWIWPRIIREAKLEDWLSRLTEARSYNLAGLMVAGPGIAGAVHDRYPHIDLWGSIDLNVWNHCAIRIFAPLFRTLVLSPECSLSGIRDLMRSMPANSPSVGCMVQGNLEVMVSENCPDERIQESEPAAWGLLDIRDRLFPVIPDEDGRTHIYNAVETCYIDHLNELREAGITSFVIEGRYRSPRYIREVTSLYREALRRLQIGKIDCTDLKEEIRIRARGGITLGALIRGLKEET